MTTTGSSGSISCDWRNSASPSIPSIFRSVTSGPRKSRLKWPTADAALSCATRSNPARPSHCVTASRIDASSSTKRTGPRSGMDDLLRRHRVGGEKRELDHDLGATLRAVGSMNSALEILHDAVGDRQAEPQPFSDRLGCDERIEDALDQIGRDARSVVGDANAHEVADVARLDLD